MIESLLIGSKAAKHWFYDFPREPKDTDLISKSISRSKELDVHYAPSFEALLCSDRAESIATPNELYTIKLSHSFWDVHWEKTMYDIGFFQSKRCQVIEPLYKMLYADWEKIHGKKKVNLNITNEEFFNKNVDRKFEHDWLHEQIKYYSIPMYKKMKNNQSRAWINKDIFESSLHEDKIKTVREEAFVVALERWIIPSNYAMNPMVAYKKALKALVTHMTKGWFARFIVENYIELKYLTDSQKYFIFIKKGENNDSRQSA